MSDREGRKGSTGSNSPIIEASDTNFQFSIKISSILLLNEILHFKNNENIQAKELSDRIQRREN